MTTLQGSHRRVLRFDIELADGPQLSYLSKPNTYIVACKTGFPSNRVVEIPDVSLYGSPARAIDLSGLHPTFVDVGSAELFRDD